MEPGDFLLVQTHHLVSWLIRFGQRGYGPECAKWNHVALYVGGGKIVEALTGGVVLSDVGKYPAKDVRVISIEAQLPGGLVVDALTSNPVEAATSAMRGNAAAFARSCVGESYGFVTILAIALKVLTRGRLGFGVQGTSICSGLVARSLERLGYNWNPWDAAELTPAYLAKSFGVV